ncbi:MAG TPA: mannosyltransferase family protein [Vicinamibacterales bacterium]|nr:mannosyltransferase family protein [Vicinamibacterales bacterium]
MPAVALARRSPSAPIVFDVAAGACLIAGNTLGGLIFPPQWMVGGLFPPVFVGMALVAIRCVRYPVPSLFATWWPRATAHAVVRTALSVALVTRAAVLAVGLVAAIHHPARFTVAPKVSDDALVNLPARWDAFWYLGIARYGYEAAPTREDHQHNIAFFPAYPAAMRVAGDLVVIPAYLFNAPSFLGNGDSRVLWGGVFASVLFFALALARLQRLASIDLPPAAADRACVLTAVYPFALFFSAPYSESLALLALVSLVLAWRARDGRGVWWGILFGLTRSNGWCVAVALAADRLLSREPGRSRVSWWLVASAPIGAALYSLYVWHLTGHPLQWAAAQHAWGGKLQPLEFVVRRWNTIDARGLRGYVRHDPADAAAFVAAMGMLAASVWLLARRQWLYGMLILAYLGPAIAIDLPATGRMTALLFPAFFILAERFRGVRFAALAILFAVGQAWLASRFFEWRTPY